MSKMSYLKPNVKFEPLIWRWYAWPHLIQPLTAGCNVLDRHLKIMESFIQSPEIHEQSLKIPEMIGGPFANIHKSRVGEVESLLKKTNEWCESIINLAIDYKKFDIFLQENAHGYSLDNFYKEAPVSLDGMFELVYDGNNSPKIRLFETFIYKNYYNKNNQCCVMSSIENDNRPFLLSTPRLEDENELAINLEFSNPLYDNLFAAKYEPVDKFKLFESLEIPTRKYNYFSEFFSDEKSIQNKPHDFSEHELRVRYFGHATILLETKDCSILIDPIISYSYNQIIDRYTYNDLPEKIDYVLLTHNHQDHIQIETLIQLRHRINYIVVPSNNPGSIFDPSMKLILQKLGFNRVISLDDFESIQLNNGKILSLPFLGEHADLPIYTKAAYCIILGKKKLLFAADSNNLCKSLYSQIYSFVGTIDILFLGMECEGAPLSWVYGPLTSKRLERKMDNSRRLSGSNSDKDLDVAKQLGSKEIYVYAMGMEPWLSYIMGLSYSDDSIQIQESNKFISRCRQQGKISKRLYGKEEFTYSVN